MSHLTALALCLVGFSALALATRRQQRDLIGRSLPLMTTHLLRVCGTAALLLSLGVLVTANGWALGLVMFSGHTSIAAGIVYGILIGYARSNQRRARHR